MFLSVVIPAYNESARLPRTLDRVISYLDAAFPDQYEILVVDDGSTDQTADLVWRRGASAPRLRLITSPRNFGKGHAVRQGLLAASANWVLLSDADLSTPIEEIHHLLDAASRSGAQVAIGSRSMAESKLEKKQPLFRVLSGMFFRSIARGLLGLKFRDTQCGFKLFTLSAARSLASRQKLDGFAFDVELLYLARQLGYHSVEVPVVWRDAEGSRVTLRKGLAAFADLLRIYSLHRLVLPLSTGSVPAQLQSGR